MKSATKKEEAMELKEFVKEYQEKLKQNDYWTVIWKDKDDWQVSALYLPPGECLDHMDAAWLDGIYEKDKKAIVINPCYWDDTEISAQQIESMYENCLAAYQIPRFLKYYLEKERAWIEQEDIIHTEAHRTGLTFSKKAYTSTDRFDPYVFDGSMELDAYEYMHECMREQTSECKKQRKKKKGNPVYR